MKRTSKNKKNKKKKMIYGNKYTNINVCTLLCLHLTVLTEHSYAHVADLCAPCTFVIFIAITRYQQQK